MYTFVIIFGGSR